MGHPPFYGFLWINLCKILGFFFFRKRISVVVTWGVKLTEAPIIIVI
jgi:hypothetical protein